MIDWIPPSIAVQLGPIPVYFYGIAYAVGIFLVYVVATRMARRYDLDLELIGNGMIIIGIAALVGGRAYHVIDQFNACGPGGPCYSQDLPKIFLPPYTGLGVYGGIVTGLIAFAYLIRRWRQDLWSWMDVIAPCIFVMQAAGRWGNFFNQELYGPPTTLPWGIAIDCAHRVAPYLCPPGSDPTATLGQHFTPLFLYESVSGIAGALVLIWLASKPRPRLRRGDLLPIGLIWYAIVRYVLENLRTGNWKLEGIATAQLFSIGFIALAVALLAYRHRTAPPEDMVGVPPMTRAPTGDQGEDGEGTEDGDPDDDGDRVSAAVVRPPADPEPLT
ncbi:MAG TPA: prolipoprotein diacylglyceryl transferase [Candidatus Limnocylindrales bacterium]